MDIQKKIREIRSMPDHIRMRYVWGSVTICMVIIVIIWIFSVSIMFKQETSTEEISQFKEKVKETVDNAPSISDYTSKSYEQGQSQESTTNNADASLNEDNSIFPNSQINSLPNSNLGEGVTQDTN